MVMMADDDEGTAQGGQRQTLAEGTASSQLMAWLVGLNGLDPHSLDLNFIL